MEFVKKVNALVLGLAVLLAIGCGSEVPEPEKESQERTCKVTKSTYDQFTNKYHYNAAGKVSRVDIINPDPADNTHEEFLYDAAGNLKEIIIFGVNNVKSMQERYTYNQDNLPDTIYYLHQGSGGTSAADGYMLHQYNSAKQLLKTSYFPDRQATVPNNTADFTYPAPGQAIEKQYIKNAAGILQLEYTAHYQFDDKPNPLADLAHLNQLFMVMPHNLTAFQITYHTSGFSSSQTTAYSYNAEGYPVSYTISSPDFPSVSGSYEYNCQ
jgi:hypothetical protein